MTAEIDLSTFTQSVYKRPDVNHVNLYKVDHIFWMESKSRICETFNMLNFKKRLFVTEDTVFSLMSADEKLY